MSNIDKFPGIDERDAILDKLILADQFSGELAMEQHSPKSRNGTVGKQTEARSVNTVVREKEKPILATKPSSTERVRVKLLGDSNRDRRDR